MKLSARIISLLTHPYLVPFYGSAIAVTYSYIALLVYYYKLFICSGILFFSGLLPLLFRFFIYLYNRKQDDEHKTPRYIKLLFYVIMLLFCWLFASKMNMPVWFQYYMGGAFLSACIVCIINYIGWRISIYMASLGALWGLLFFMPSDISLGTLVVLILATGATGTARMLLEKNNFLQMLTGLICGFAGTFILPLLQIFESFFSH